MSKGFDALLTFPTLFVFRIIAYKDGTIESSSVDALKRIFERIEATESLPSKSGRFIRLHIAVMATSGAQLYQGYDVLKEIEGIRMVF
jgi:putative lipoic acid-binding regulatory protein